jgi:hypothetical protein
MSAKGNAYVKCYVFQNNCDILFLFLIEYSWIRFINLNFFSLKFRVVTFSVLSSYVITGLKNINFTITVFKLTYARVSAKRTVDVSYCYVFQTINEFFVLLTEYSWIRF